MSDPDAAKPESADPELVDNESVGNESVDNVVIATEPDVRTINRRGIISGLALGGAAIVGGAVGALTTASVAGAAAVYRRKDLTVDVACLGETWSAGAKGNHVDDEDDFRAPFLVEGLIYPNGTIPGDGFIPVEEGSIGRWFCRGYFLVTATRTQPHVSSNHDFYFGTISPEHLFPTSMLASVGLEGTDDKAQISTRPVIGGTGDYVGATGQVRQEFIAMNTSVFPDSTDPSPCFRFQFDIRILE
jgi:hypothetical protein